MSSFTPPSASWSNVISPAPPASRAPPAPAIVALHRAAFIARSSPNARILLTTFSDALASTLHLKLRALLHHEPRLGERIEVHSMAAIARRLYQFHIGTPRVAPRETVRSLLEAATKAVDGLTFSARFLHAEWDDIVDAWQLDSWDAYRTVNRLGRKTRLTENQRKALWPVFASVRASLAEQGFVTDSEVFSRLAQLLQSGTLAPPFQFAVVDEAQDIGIAQLRFLAALAGDQPNGLFFAGDLGQRIFQAPFSWKALGVDIRGRSTSLKINYRTSHQIRQHADRLLMAEVADVDGNTEQRTGTVSLFNGPQPAILVEGSERLEIKAVGDWLKARISDGLKPHEIGVFVRSADQFSRARSAVEAAALPCHVLDHDVDVRPGSVPVSTMHLAKGLEFRAVAVIACDDEVVPLQARISAVVDEADLDEVYSTERHLLYVACTRARDQLLITAVDPGSEFLDDLRKT